MNSSTSDLEQRHHRQRDAVSRLIQSKSFYEGDCESVIRQITETAAQTLAVQRVSIWQYNKDRSAIRCRDLFELSENRHVNCGELFAGTHPGYFEALTSSEIIAANDARVDPRTREFASDYLVPNGITSMLDAPIHIGGIVEGVLCHEHVGPPRQWTEDEKSFAVTLANLVTLAVEVAERARAQAEARSSERRFSEVFRANPAAMSISSVDDGLLINVNDRYAEFFGYTREELVGKSLPELNLWARPAERARMIERVRAEKSIRDIETQFRHKSGALRDVFASFVLLDVPGEGEPILVSMLVDVTERKRLEEHLRQSQKLESIGQLAGGVAHDFNNILTVIQGHASLLLAGPGELSSRGDSAEQIAKSAERAANLTRQLLAFSRRQVMQPKDLDLNEIVRDMTRMLNRILGEDIRLQVEFSSVTPIVRADPGMMEQVILNLAVNARDAMPRGGSLKIRNSIEQIDASAARTNPEVTAGSVVRLTVTDTGCGIPVDVLPHVFEPFFTTKEVGKGTGLGLATVYGIVKQHHGWINVQSKVNEGTSFDIFLPRSQATAASEKNSAPKQIPKGAETILIVEDELTVRLLTRRLLESLGYKVLEACDGDSALEMWASASKQIDLVVTDMVMPGGMSGMDLGEKLRADKPDLKIIFCSGHNVEMFGKELALKEGMLFLPKPYDNVKLAAAVRSCLDA